MEISTALVDAILGDAARDPDREVCGLLFGTDSAVLSFQPTENVSPTPARTFEIDPQALFAAIRAERRGGPKPIGHYHSHPTGRPAPSPCDAAAAEPGKLWLIAAGNQLAAFRSEAGGPIHGAFTAESLTITA